MNKKFFVAPLIALSTMGAAQAQSFVDELTVTGTAGLFSDYRFRGISQTDKSAAFQGGFTAAHKSGFYIGNWNSNVSGGSYPGSSLEMDIFGGYATEVAGVGLDVGVLHYYYPGSAAGAVNPDTTELYAGAKYGPALLKVSYSTSRYFGAPDSEGTIYANLSVAQPITDKVTVSAAAGFTLGENTADYNDYVVGVSYALPQNFTVGLNYHFNAGKGADFSASPRDLGSDGAVIYVSKAF